MGWKIASDNHMGIGFMTTIMVLLVIDLFCVLIRLYARFLQKSLPGLSDYMLICGFVMTNGSAVIMWATYAHGFGLDQSRFRLADAEMLWKLMAPGSIVWMGSTTAIRVSMTLFYRNLFHPVKTFMRVSAAVIALNAGAYLAVIIASLVICRPMHYAAFSEGPGDCGDIRSFQTYSSTAAIVLDVITVALPMPLVWKLATSRRRKWGLSFIFGLGVLICIVTIVRLIISYHYKTNNLTIQTALSMFLSVLEPTMGIIIVCMPFFPVFIAHVRQAYRSSFLSLDRLSWSRSRGRRAAESCVEESIENGNSNSHSVNDGYTAAIVADPLARPRYPSSVRSSAPLSGGYGKNPDLHQHEIPGSASAYRLDTLSVTKYGSALGIDVDVVGQRDGTAALPPARVAEEGRIYITRDFEIQSYVPKCNRGRE